MVLLWRLSQVTFCISYKSIKVCIKLQIIHFCHKSYTWYYNSMNRIPLVSFEKEFELLKDSYIESFKHQLEISQFIGGSSVINFEKKIADYFNVKHAIGVGNGTDALLIALESIKLNLSLDKKNNKVLTPAFSFFATSEALVKAGFEPIFVDVNLETGNINVDHLEALIDENVVGILPVHLFGKSADLEKILTIAEKYNLFVVEDVAQAFGSRYQKKLLGTLGDAGCFSFFPSKNLGAFGDGGMIITNNDEVAKYSKMLRNHGAEKKYQNEIFGYNSRLDSIQANFLSIKLDHIDSFIESRVEIGTHYIKKLKNNKNLTLLNYEDSSFNYFSLRVRKDRNDLLEYLDSKGISTAIYYPVPLPNLNAHVSHRTQEHYENASSLADTIFSLPIWPMMSLDTVDVITDEINEYYN